jgi:hypothetical protein
MATTNGSPELWDLEAEFFARKGGAADGDLERARTFVMLRWMYFGDFRPFLAWRCDDASVLGMFIYLIKEGRLKVTQSGRRYRHKDPSAFARSLYAAVQYENSKGKSDARFAEIAEKLGMSKSAIRQAVTRRRKLTAPSA